MSRVVVSRVVASRVVVSRVVVPHAVDPCVFFYCVLCDENVFFKVNSCLDDTRFHGR